MIPGQENIIPECVITEIRTDYLKAMTEIYLEVEKSTERVRKKYRLSKKQMENLIKTL